MAIKQFKVMLARVVEQLKVHSLNWKERKQVETSQA